MTTNPKARKAPPAKRAELDPILAAITEHKMLIEKSNRLEKSCRAARARAEKKHGGWIEHIRGCRSENRPKDEWPGYPIISPFYARWNLACRAESKEAKLMARTEPATLAGAAAMIDHIRRETAGASTIEDWVAPALKTVVAALARMEIA